MTANKKRIPKIRFKEFWDSGEWEEKKLGEVVFLKNGYTPSKNNSEYWKNGHIPWFRMEDIRANGHILSDSIQHITPQAVKGGGLFEANSIILSTTATIGEYALITVNFLANQRFTCLTLKCQEKDNISITYLYHYMYFISKWCKRNTHSNTFEAVSTSALKEAIVYLPSLPEQQKIAACLSSLDELIGLEKEKLEKLKEYKKGLLQNLFPKENQKVPDLRFKEFQNSGEWEERKLGEVVFIERGGSPRPIDDFITNDKNGLNWVKIGDAPDTGNIITQTAKKIRQEGLSKTREVHPGDLILSNSMSFGKPYIMGISGCIHDGWLLIRNEKGVFDLKFLCQLLGTEQTLKQYHSLAAGSTVRNLNKELVGNTIVKFPTMLEQQKIADFLSSLDDLITEQTKKINDLKDYKKGLMQQLFPSENVS